MANIDELVKQMSLDEKISLLAGVDLWHTAAVPRLGIPAIKVTDGPNGARGAWADMGPSSALMPVGTALGATWNTELVEQVGAALAEEVKAKGAHVLLAPTVNIHRTPIAGRNFECYSEDPFLTGKMASAYIRGLQKNEVSGCIKHFACNDQEFQRMSISSEVDERPLREIYLEPFRRAMVEAKPWSIMSSYNRVNGTYASENAWLLKTLLKEEWGFDGMVMSDWKGTYSDNVPSGGLDLEMPGPAHWMSAEYVKKAMANGALTADEIDEKVCRVLKLIERVGGFAHPANDDEKEANGPEQRAFIRSVAQETIVLLKNEKALLPLDPGRIKKIAVIGELAQKPNVMGGGSSHVNPYYVVSPLEGIQARAGGQVSVTYAMGCTVSKTAPFINGRNFSVEASEDGKTETRRGLRMRIYDNLDFSGEPAFENITDRGSFEWWGQSVPNADSHHFCARLDGTFTADQAGEQTFALSSIGQSRLWLDDELLIDNWDDDTMGKERTARKAMTAGQNAKFKVEFRFDSREDWRCLRVGHLPPAAANPMEEAVALAAEADVVIVVAGLTSQWESEDFDRVDMELPGAQNELIEKVVHANPNTIVVLNAGSPVGMPWAEQVPAIVEQWYNSQECGNALADILFGDVNPSGKLPTTFPVRYEDNPAFANYPGENGKVFYREGLFVGYRHYDARGVKPRFPFGYGLSYTTFEFANLKAGQAEFNEAEGLDIALDLKNTGTRAGKEVVQLYVHDTESTLERPEQELKAFTKVELQAGESKTIHFHLDPEAFSAYDPAQQGWAAEPGKFEIRAGRSSRDLPLRAEVELMALSAESAK